MWGYPEPISRLIEQFMKLPSVGPKTATRLAFHVLQMEEQSVKDFAAALIDVKSKLTECAICCNITDRSPCRICSDNARDDKVVCVVQEAKDVAAMERTHEFQGKYHVLHGAISPMEGIAPTRSAFGNSSSALRTLTYRKSSWPRIRTSKAKPLRCISLVC